MIFQIVEAVELPAQEGVEFQTATVKTSRVRQPVKVELTTIGQKAKAEVIKKKAKPTAKSYSEAFK